MVQENVNKIFAVLLNKLIRLRMLVESNITLSPTLYSGSGRLFLFALCACTVLAAKWLSFAIDTDSLIRSMNSDTAGTLVSILVLAAKLGKSRTLVPNNNCVGVILVVAFTELFIAVSTWIK